MEHFNRIGEGLASPRATRFAVTGSELNLWLAMQLRSGQRSAVRSLEVTLADGDVVSGVLIADAAEVERLRPGSIPPLVRSVLGDRITIEFTLHFVCADHRLTVDLQRVQVQGVPVPPSLASQVLRSVALSQPEHYDLSRPIPSGVLAEMHTHGAHGAHEATLTGSNGR